MGFRRLYLFLLTLCTAVVCIYASITYTLPDRSISVTRDYNVPAVFQSADVYLSMPGKPELPCYTLTFLLPYNADLATVSVSIRNGKTQQLPGAFSVAPTGPYLVDGKEVWFGNESIVQGKDPLVYGQDRYFPENHIAHFSTGKMRKYNLLEVTICPVAYNPATGSLRRIIGGSLLIDFKPVNRSKLSQIYPYPIPLSFQNRARALTVNYADFADE
jgi:hypothetical protein